MEERQSGSSRTPTTSAELGSGGRYQQKYYAHPKQRPRHPAQNFPRHKTHRRFLSRGGEPANESSDRIGWDPGNFPERLNSRPKRTRAASTLSKARQITGPELATPHRRDVACTSAVCPKTQQAASIPTFRGVEQLCVTSNAPTSDDLRLNRADQRRRLFGRFPAPGQ